MAKVVKKSGTGYGVASLVLGIIGLLLFVAPYFGIILSILAIIFSVLQKKQQPTGLATAGFVLGIIGIIVNVILLIMVIVVLATVGTAGLAAAGGY